MSIFSFLVDRLGELHSLAKKETKLAFLMSDWYSKDSENNIIIADYCDLLRGAGWRITRHIQVPLSNQQVPGFQVTNFRESKQLAYLERYLLIAERRNK